MVFLLDHWYIQGDPFSQYIVIISAEIQSILIRNSDKIHSLKIDGK